MGNENYSNNNSINEDENIELSNEYSNNIEENNDDNSYGLSMSNINLNSSIESINEINNDNYKKYYEKDKKSRKINGYPINSFIDTNDINIINEFKCPICLDIVYKTEDFFLYYLKYNNLFSIKSVFNEINQQLKKEEDNLDTFNENQNIKIREIEEQINESLENQIKINEERDKKMLLIINEAFIQFKDE